MTLSRLLATALALIISSATSAHAVLDLTGVIVQGELFINDTTPPQTNFFDPFVGKVPAGFGNSLPPGSGEAEALVSNSIVEFGYQGGSIGNPQTDTATTIQVNFTNTGVVQVSANQNPFSSVSMNFFSPAFTPQVTLTTITGTSAIAPVYANNTATFTFTAMSAGPFSFSGTYLLNIAGTPPPQIPEPASLTLLGLGLAGIIARCRKRA